MPDTDRPTAEQMAEWRRLAETGPTEPLMMTNSPGIDDYFRVRTLGESWRGQFVRYEDAEFFVAARVAVPVLLAEVERLRQTGHGLVQTAHGFDDLMTVYKAQRDDAQARLAALLPIARAAVRLEKAHAALDITLDDDKTAAGEAFAGILTEHRAAQAAFHGAVAAIDPALRDELEREAGE